MDQRLHQQAIEVAFELLEHLNTKPTAFLVAVLWHDIPMPLTDACRESFMFVKCTSKTSVGKIRDSYLSREEAPSDISLHLGSTIPPHTAKVSELDQFNDKVVVFYARSVDPLDTTNATVPAFASTTLKPQYASRSNENGHSGAPSAGLPMPARQPSASSGLGTDQSGQSTASSALSLSGMSGYTTNPHSPHAKPAPAPSTLAGGIFRDDLALSSSNHQNSVYHTPSWYAQASGSPLVKNEPFPPSYPNQVPCTSPSYAQIVQPLQSFSGSYRLASGAPHNPVQYGKTNDNSHGSSAAQPNNEHPGIKSEVPLPAPLPLQPIDDYEIGNTSSMSPVTDDAPQYARSSVYLQALSKDSSAEKLEAGVKYGAQMLDRLVEMLGPGKETEDIRQWLQQIEVVRQEASGARTVVGVVGNTGAGKSSVINAILDEERLVPTNCMRACTAVVTEMSWNPSEDENSKYRAEIEFIKPAEWEKELRVLFEEVIDGSGNISREVSNPDSQAGIAYAKIRAVYWRLTREDLTASSIEKLMADRSVQGLLGTIKYIKDHSDDEDEDSFKGTGDKDKKKKKTRKREQEFWPLIKVVRLYVKADALSTGAVLVDLPGVADSNAARAAVAEGYMKQCTGLWIVSPINRAVDDKAAKNLLGSTFRRQLKYDGTYSGVTFICSKTDDISNTEAADSLGLGDELEELEEQLTIIERGRRAAEKETSQLKDKKSSLRKTMDNCDDEIEKWEALQVKLNDGKIAYAPAAKTRKRKRSSSGSDSEDEDRISDNSDAESQPSDRGQPLTAEDIETKIQELKDQKKEARRGRSEIEAEVKDLNNRIKNLKVGARNIEDNRSRICIDARNQYSKSAIQVDFAAGIKELDQETAADEDPDTFNPEEDLRDYDKVAKELPVFCVSSRAYQKLSGRLVKDNAVRGFTDVEQTEIPALKLHCKKLTENVRSIKSRRFLTLLNQLCTSLALWSSNDGSGAIKTDQQKDAEQRFLARNLKDLEKALEKDVHATLTEITETMNENIFENYGTAISAAANAALPTSQGWGARRSQGGLYWVTYKAVVRRQGVFTGSGGLSDFNAQLTEPIYKHLANGWEKAFQRRLPHVLKACAKGFSNDLRSFHKAIEVHSFSHGGNPRLGLLSQQLSNYEAVFNDLGSKMIELINERQRDINREFTPLVCNAMLAVYNICTAEAGPGQYNRMKTHMTNHVTAQEGHHDVEEHMANRVDQVFVGMRRDYLQVLSNVRVDDILMPKWERSLRGTIEDVIHQSEEGFEAILEGRDMRVLENDASAGALVHKEDHTNDEDVEAAPVEKKTKEDTDIEDDTYMDYTHF
ncbi:hypothetical protein QM012_008730 [Aureobasidium pullulans]|uniref:P-loop containing nucleoside triphosphate hydrolase protein n=1 Tax=Aureobasidium pullulans TaxID=5580 RepID=A0ABR0TIT9_AURPU